MMEVNLIKCIYSGVKSFIWFQALTLLNILPGEGNLRYDYIKIEVIKRHVNYFSCPFFKNT